MSRDVKLLLQFLSESGCWPHSSLKGGRAQAGRILESTKIRMMLFLHCNTHLLGDDGPSFTGDDLILPCEVFFTFLKDSRTEVWWTIDGKNTDDITDPKIKVTQR